METIDLGKKIIFGINELFIKEESKTLENSDFTRVWLDIVMLPMIQIESFISNSAHTKAGYTRDQAVIYGLLLRIYKTLTMERRIVCAQLINRQLATMFSRVLLEDNINLQYYIRHPEKIDDFCKSCVKAEQELAALIDKRRSESAETWTETMLKWEDGLMESVNRGLSIAGVTRNDKLPRTPDMKTKAKDVGLEELYTSYRIECHVIHGDWFDIARYSMTEKDGRFYPKFEIDGTDIRQFNPILEIVYKSLDDFITLYQGHGIDLSITEELKKDVTVIHNFDVMHFNFLHHVPLITELEDQVEIVGT